MLEKLSGADFARIEFVVEFEEPFVLRQEMILRLRRELRKAAQAIAADEPGLGEKILAMLDPVPANDPYARKKFQKPAPPFAVKPPLSEVKQVDAGDQVALEVVFFGDVSLYLNLFCLMLGKLGQLGFWQGEGCFDLVNLYGLDHSGERIMLPLPDRPEAALPVPMLSLAWMIEEKLAYNRQTVLEFLTPARLMTSGKPLFRIGFGELFPFLLRRVTAMLYMWYGLEPIRDAGALIALANEFEVVSCDLYWRDWRTLDADGRKQDIGGITGTVVLENVWPDEFGIVLCLGELANVGKNAAYGCGQFKLSPTG